MSTVGIIEYNLYINVNNEWYIYNNNSGYYSSTKSDNIYNLFTKEYINRKGNFFETNSKPCESFKGINTGELYFYTKI